MRGMIPYRKSRPVIPEPMGFAMDDNILLPFNQHARTSPPPSMVDGLPQTAAFGQSRAPGRHRHPTQRFTLISPKVSFGAGAAAAVDQDQRPQRVDLSRPIVAPRTAATTAKPGVQDRAVGAQSSRGELPDEVEFRPSRASSPAQLAASAAALTDPRLEVRKLQETRGGALIKV